MCDFFFFKQKTAYEIGVRLVGSEMCIRDSLSQYTMSTPEKQKRRFFFAKRHSFGRIFSIHAGNRAIRAGFLDFFPQMWYIQDSQMFPVFTISFHHSKEVFVCCLIVSLRCVFWVGLSIRGGGNDSPRPASQRAAAFILTAAMLTTLTAPAFAQRWDIEKGDITVKAGEAEGPNEVKQGDNDFVKDEGETIITGTSNENTVTIDTSEGNVDVTFDDLKIDASSRGYKDPTDTGKAAVSVTGKGDTNIELDGDNELKSGYRHAGLEHNQTVDSEGNVTSGKLTIQDKDNNGSLDATGGFRGAGIGGGEAQNGQVTITGGTITATAGSSSGRFIYGGGSGIGGGDGGTGVGGNGDVEITGGTITATGFYGAGIGGGRSADGDVTISGGTIKKAESLSPTDPGYPVPADTSSSGGGSADASVQESVFPGLVVTDKDGQHISYTSIRGNNVLSIRVGRFTASLRASLATLRQLRAEGIDTITFQTILCSTTLSVDELLAMGGEDAEAVLTHRLTASSLTVG